MSTLPPKTFWPTLADEVNRVCKFVQVHETTLNAVVATVSPGDAAAVALAFTTIRAACSLFLGIMAIIDPNWKPS